MVEIPLKDQIAEVRRELAIRRRVYPRWVEQNQLTLAAMLRQLARLEAVLATLEACQTYGSPYQLLLYPSD